MTEPTARPALAGVAISGAMGSRTWVTAARAPVTRVMSTMGSNDGTTAVTSMAMTSPAIILRMRLRRSRTSPSGTKKSSPMAYPACAATATWLICASVTWRLRAISMSRGWLK